MESGFAVERESFCEIEIETGIVQASIGEGDSRRINISPDSVSVIPRLSQAIYY